jgi:photosystem II stability/assembly factor-like uncharacterized protein
MLVRRRGRRIRHRRRAPIPFMSATPHTTMHLRHSVATALLLVATTSALWAQDPGMLRPGEADVQMSNPARRAEYFHMRRTYPGGSIPEGARVRAWRRAQLLPQYAPPAGKTGVTQDLQWVNRGPDNIGGRIVAVAANPKNAATIFIGAADGGIWRTRDRGAHWTSVSDDLPIQAMGAIAIDPVDTNVVYAGTGEASFAQRTFDGGGMFKSTDGGDTWRAIGESTLPPFARAADIVINPSDPRILYCAIPDGVRDSAHEGLWRSVDAGATWTLVLDGRMTDVVLSPADPRVLYTVSSKVFGGGTAPRYGLFKSVDGGDSWAKLDVGVTDSLMGRTSIGICASQPEVLYVGVSQVTSADRTFLIGVYKTTDAGGTWTKCDVPYDYMVSQGWYDNILGVNPLNPDVAYAGGVSLLVTRDGGRTWERVPDQGVGGIVHVDQHAIDFAADDPHTVYLGNDGGFFVGTGDGRSWEKRDRGLSITQFIGGAMPPATDAMLFGGTQDNGTLQSSAAPAFDLVLYGDGGNGAVNPRNPAVMYATRETLKFFRSDDGGATWANAQRGMKLDRALFYLDYAMDPSHPDTLYLGTARLYRTTDGAGNWVSLNDCLFGLDNSCYYISTLFVAPYDGRIVLAGSTGAGVAVSRDCGATWSRTPTGAVPAAYCSSVRTYAPGVFYATFSLYGVDKVWVSRDTGSTWTSINGDLPDIPVNDLIDFGGHLVIGTDLGAFASDDGGTHWQRFGTGLPALSIQRLKYNAATGTLRAWTHGRGIYDLSWSAPAAAAPVFLSLPDTTAVPRGTRVVYAPVTSGAPGAAYSLTVAPPGATIDAATGLVTCIVSAQMQFSIRAVNAAGAAEQTFTVPVAPDAAADWEVTAVLPFAAQPLALHAQNGSSSELLWVACDSGLVARHLMGAWTVRSIPDSKASVPVIDARDSLDVWVGTADGRVLATTDGGASWKAVLQRPNGRFSNLARAGDLAVAICGDANRLDSADVYVTRDAGATWSLCMPRPRARQPIDRTLTLLDASHWWFASSNASLPSPASARVLRTTDGGVTWTDHAASTNHVTSLSFTTVDTGFAVDEMSGYVMRSVNGGRAWRAVFPPMYGLRNVRVHAQPGAFVWVVSDTSAWFSADGGELWQRTQMVPEGRTQDASFGARKQEAWAVSRGGVLQRLARGPVTGVRTVSSVPAGLHIGQNYPNPVEGADGLTMLPFTLSACGRVTVAVFNSAGREVARVLDRDLEAGEYAVPWRTDGLPAGTYFFTVRAGRETRTGRMLVIR